MSSANWNSCISSSSACKPSISSPCLTAWARSSSITLTRTDEEDGTSISKNLLKCQHWHTPSPPHSCPWQTRHHLRALLGCHCLRLFLTTIYNGSLTQTHCSFSWLYFSLQQLPPASTLDISWLWPSSAPPHPSLECKVCRAGLRVCLIHQCQYLAHSEYSVVVGMG